MGFSAYSTSRLVLARRGPDDVRALQGVLARLAQEVHHGVLALCAVHHGERLEGVLARLLVFYVREQPVRLQASDRCDRHALHPQRARQAPAEVHAGQHVLALRIELPDHAAQPALGPDLLGQRRVPYVHRPEVGAVRLRVADAVDDRHLALVPQPLQRLQVGPEGQLVVDLQQPLRVVGYRRAVVVVQPVLVRHHRVQVVVAAAKLQHHQRPISPVRAVRAVRSIAVSHANSPGARVSTTLERP